MLWALRNSIISVSCNLNVNLGFLSPSPACLLTPCSEIETEYTISRQKPQWGAKCQLPAHPCRESSISACGPRMTERLGVKQHLLCRMTDKTHIQLWRLPQKQNWGLRCFKDALRRGHFDVIIYAADTLPTALCTSHANLRVSIWGEGECRSLDSCSRKWLILIRHRLMFCISHKPVVFMY